MKFLIYFTNLFCKLSTDDCKLEFGAGGGTRTLFNSIKWESFERRLYLVKLVDKVRWESYCDTGLYASRDLRNALRGVKASFIAGKRSEVFS
ncbi:MAG: hypothetical protein WCI55_11860 [Armatimonadota bacterium]